MVTNPGSAACLCVAKKTKSKKLHGAKITYELVLGNPYSVRFQGACLAKAVAASQLARSCWSTPGATPH